MVHPLPCAALVQSVPMNRRTWILASLGAGLPTNRLLRAETHPIQLHADLEVAPSREKEMEHNYHHIFRPAIRVQPGFLDVRLLKLREVLAGQAPANSRYRLLISFESEEQRMQWVATDEHQQAWPTIEKTLTGSRFTAILYDLV